MTQLNASERVDKMLYRALCAEKYCKWPYDTVRLDEDMGLVNEVIGKYWKPRFLMDHRAGSACEFMGGDECLKTVTCDDIAWGSLTGLPECVVDVAKKLSFHFPSFIRNFRNDVGEVSWKLRPDGRYYMDDSGYGMTDDVEVVIYGYIDRRGHVLVPFRMIDSWSELTAMRKEAEQKLKLIR